MGFLDLVKFPTHPSLTIPGHVQTLFPARGGVHAHWQPPREDGAEVWYEPLRGVVPHDADPRPRGKPHVDQGPRTGVAILGGGSS